MDTEKRYDVVIFEVTSRKVTAIAGTNLPTTGSHHTVDGRLETVKQRINEHYDVESVPAGTLKVGDIVP